jgi:Protein of unknown function (DUF2924)/Protein of unknown function (DUF3489)
MSIKLSDTQLVILSAAARRDDRSLTPPEKLKVGAAHKVAVKLIAAGLVKEIRAKAGTPVWRRDEQNAQSYALKLTAAGLKAIAVTPDDDAAHAADEERSRKEVDQSPSFAQPARTAAGASSAPSAQALPMPRAPRVGTKLAQAIEMLRATEGVTIAELAEAMGWLPHTARAVLTGLPKRGDALSLDRSDARRGSAYRITANDAHAGTAPTVVEPSSGALIDGASDPSVSPAPTRVSDGAASLPFVQDIASSVMARRRSSRGAGEGLSSLAQGPVDESELREAVANLATLDLTGLRLQWGNIFGGTAPLHLPKPLLARIIAYRLQADALGDLPDTVRRTLEGFGAQSSAPSGEARGNDSSCRRRIKPGSILVREWDGRLQRVTALEEGFAWEGKTYRSLSMVARAITGGHWNGPRFFGLTGSKAMVRAAAAIASTEQAQTSRVEQGRRAAP